VSGEAHEAQEAARISFLMSIPNRKMEETTFVAPRPPTPPAPKRPTGSSPQFFIDHPWVGRGLSSFPSSPRREISFNSAPKIF